MEFSKHSIKKIVKIVIIVYLLGLLFLPLTFLRNPRFVDPLVLLPNLLISANELFILLGLHRKRPWVIPLILISSTYRILGWLVLPAPENTPYLSYAISRFLGIAFQSLLFYFFSRKEVKSYFGYRGLTLF